MTVIAAVHQNGETWIGADSWRWEGDTIIKCQQKLMVADNFVLGMAGPVRAQQLMERDLKGIAAAGDEFAVANYIRGLLKADDFCSTDVRDGTGPKQYGVSILLATRTALFLIAGTFDAVRIPDGQVYAVGSGADYAMGAGFALHDKIPSFRIRRGIEAAIYCCSSVGGEPDVRCVGALANQSQLAAE